MTSGQDNPLYNLSAVLRETGLKADVLRAWERRYNLPNPVRSPGGHRLYSQQDIEVIKWLQARQAEGLSISRAAARWHELSAAGRDPWQEHPARQPYTGLSLPEGMQVAALQNAWLDACLKFDEATAEAVLNQAFALLPVEAVCHGILQGGLSQMGDWWQQGTATVQQEHFASGLAMRRLQALLTACPPPWREQAALTGCPPGERHAYPALLASLLLRRKGFRVVYLGADIPSDQMLETAAAVQPALILLAAQQLPAAASLQKAANDLAGQGWQIGFGGRIFNRIPALRSRMAGHFLGENLAQAVSRAEQLLAAPRPTPQASPANEVLSAAAQSLMDNKAAVEIGLGRELDSFPARSESLGEPNAFFISSLAAALELGDPAYLEPDLAWLEELLRSRKVPATWLGRYLAAWQRALAVALGENAAPAAAWLAGYLSDSSHLPTH